jgi:predicted transposase/invertase (TIGR01784 family)
MNNDAKNNSKKELQSDGLFKSFLNKPSMQKDFMREYLPEEATKKINFDSIQLEKDSFVEKELSQKFSDVLLSAKFKNNNQLVYCYILAEHQSSPDYWMSLRLWRYMGLIWEKFKNEHKNKRVKLPTIYPVVIYNGEKKYTTPRRITELCREPGEVDEILRGPFKLEEINQYHPEDIKKQKLVDLIRLTMNKRAIEDWNTQMKGLIEIFKNIIGVPKEEKSNYTRDILCYNENINKNNIEEMNKEINQELGKEGEEIMKSAAQEFREEGEVKGIQKGIQQGMQKGRDEGVKTIAKNMLAKGFRLQDVIEVTGLNAEEIKDLN